MEVVTEMFLSKSMIRERKEEEKERGKLGTGERSFSSSFLSLIMANA